MLMRVLRHVTLNTGEADECGADQVAGQVLEVLWPLIERVRQGEEVEVPGVEPPCSMTGKAERGGLTVTLWGPPIGGRQVPISTISVASRGSKAWRTLHEQEGGLPLTTSADLPPPEPWCAARLDVGVTVYPEANEWLGEFGRSLGWAWLLGASMTRN